MKQFMEKIKERKPKLVCLLIVEAVLLGVIFYYLVPGKRPDHAFKFFITMFLVMIPMAFELLLSLKSMLPLFCFATVYACGHTMGSCFGLYLSCPWWDKMLHFFQGALFTLLVYYLLQKLYRSIGAKRLLNLAMAVAFSVLIAVLWEVVEYTADKTLGFDMQKDTYVNEIHSYLLGDNSGDVVTIEDIQTVSVNGQELPGYTDVGLNDTMCDLIITLAGSFLFFLYGLIDRDKHPLLQLQQDDRS